MVFTILKPLLILISVSTAISLLFCDNTLSFIKYFVGASLAQFVIYNLYTKYLEIVAEKIKNERIKEFSKQGLDVKCPCYLEKSMFVPIQLGEDNSFKCGECDKFISVDVNVRTFCQTDIIDLDNAEAQLIEAYKKIQTP
jgi:predicted membrane protein